MLETGKPKVMKVKLSSAYLCFGKTSFKNEGNQPIKMLLNDLPRVNFGFLT